MKEHILPIETNPPYKSFQEPAFFLGILLTNPQYINKFYNGYINLKYDANLLWLNMCYPKYNWYTYDECDMDIESLVIKGNPYIVGKKDPYDHIMELMKNALLRGYYVNGFCDEFYISNKKNFRRIHNFHDFLLFGLCEEEQYFMSIGYRNDGQYGTYKIPFNEMYESLIWREENGQLVNNHGIAKYEFIKEKPNREYKTDIKTIQKELKNLLASKQITNEKNIFYGINGYKKFCETLPEEFDIRCLRLILEHKQIMYNRIIHIAKTLKIQIDDIISKYETIKNLAETMFHNSIRSILVNDTKLKIHVKKSLYYILEEEIPILNELSEKLNEVQNGTEVSQA